MATNNQQQRRKSRRNGSTYESRIAPIKGLAAHWGNLLVSQSFAELDEITRLAPGTGSIGGGNSMVQNLLKTGAQRGKVYAAEDGSAMMTFVKGPKVVGCAYLRVSGQFITDAQIAVF